MNLRNIMRNLLIVSFLIVSLFILNQNTIADNVDSVNNTKNNNVKIENSILFGFFGFIQYGESRGTAIAPENMPEDNKGASYEMGYGAGLNVQYRINEQWGIFLDTGYSDRRILCAKKDEFGFGSWISDMTGNTLNNSYGPFDDDVYFYIDSFIIKTGVKYFILTDDNIKPWFAIGVAFYPWNASYMNSNRQKVYGNQSGWAIDLSFLNIGIDMNIDLGDKEKIIVSLFADLGSPSVKLKFENLFQDGWTYTNDAGEDLVGIYKFGIIMLFGL
jgi:hypothetical protein